jgi:predicted O-linked N-acetylglucosamine transferase (SPINDLY family)
MGADFMDYIIADEIIIPKEHEASYSENVISLPGCYMPQDNTRHISDKMVSRSQHGLPQYGFVFCCFNKNHKINVREFKIWARLLSKIPDSVLWLYNSNRWSPVNLKIEATKLGIDPNRIIFADKLSTDEHLARHRLADLFLDTFNYNAHGTAGDALWAGLPIVTKMGDGFAGRVAGSLLSALNIPELIAKSDEGYEAVALSLATDSTKLSAIKRKLAENLTATPLFDTETYTRNLEKAYNIAYAKYCDGLEPAEFKV